MNLMKEKCWSLGGPLMSKEALRMSRGRTYPTVDGQFRVRFAH
mgnify:CR=1 FL=1